VATKYLQLRIHALKCIKMTENRQNFMGIPLETDPDAIDISAIIADPAHGVVAQAPTVYLGNRYTAGKTESWPTPKVIAEVPISDSDTFPRRVQVTVNMAEKDDGAGFDELVGRVAEELASTLSEEVGGELDSSIVESTYYREVENVVGDIIKQIFTEIGRALGLGDDPFRPIIVSHDLPSFTSAPTGTTTVDIFEPNPQHKGKFQLTYGWHLTDRTAFGSSPVGPAADSGRATAALSKPVPYPRPFRTFRFARPLTKQAKRVVVPRRTTATKPPPKSAARPMWLYPMAVRSLGDKPPK
jgi:hypothetical protein